MMTDIDWQWRYLDAQGRAMTPRFPATEPRLPEGFATQAEAETWIGEVWRELVVHGVAAVQLWHGDSLSYGPMELSAP